MSENKVRFGVKKLHVGKYTVNSDGTVTMGEPMHLPGTVKLAMDPSTEQTLFYADDAVYKEGEADLGYEGEIEHASLPDDFKVDFLGYIELSDGGIALDGNADHDPVYLLFEGGGSQSARRGILYNVMLGSIKRDHETVEKTKNPQTETLSFTIYGDDETGLVKVSWGPDSETYETLFDSPPPPDDMAYLALLDEEGEELQDDDGETIFGNVDLKTIEVYVPGEEDVSQTLNINTQLGGNVMPGIPGIRPQVEPLNTGSIEEDPGEEEEEEPEGEEDITEEEIVTETDPEEGDDEETITEETVSEEDLEEDDEEAATEEEAVSETDPEEDEEEGAADEAAESEE